MEKGFALVSLVLACAAMAVMISRMQHGEDPQVSAGMNPGNRIVQFKKDIKVLNGKIELQNAELQKLRDRFQMLIRRGQR